MADDIWTVKRILDWIEGYLEKHGDENPRVSTQWLVAEALGVSRMQLFLQLERPLSADERAVLRDWTRRRGEGEPLQYITGEVAFRHIMVKVRSGVLIPRPETEVLVSEAIALLPAAPKPQDTYEEKLMRLYAEDMRQRETEYEGPPSEEDGDEASRTAREAAIPSEEPADSGPLLVADICTGTGCIACSIASEHPLTRVIATDISADAVALARENADNLGLGERVSVVECDLGEKIDPALIGSLDLVVSNPPYIPTAVLNDIPREVSGNEPALALDGGDDGLDVFRRLLEWCAGALKPSGGFAFELHETRLDDAAAEAAQAGFTDVRIARDLAGRPRVLTARKRGETT